MFFKRVVRVQIGADNTGIEINPGDDTNNHLYVSFEIKRDLGPKPAEGFVTVYNLNDHNDSFIREKGTRIRLFAGYEGNVRLVHDGDIRRVTRRFEPGGNKATEIIIGGAVFKLASGIFNRSYSGPVQLSQIVADAVPTLSLSVGDLSAIPSKMLNDFSFTGKTTDLLTKLLRPLGVSWSEANGVLYFGAQGRPLDNAMFELSADTGMIESPTISEDGKLTVKSLLNPSIALGSSVVVKSNVASKGRFVIEPEKKKKGKKTQTTEDGDAIEEPESENEKADKKPKYTSVRSLEANGTHKVIAINHHGDNRNGDFFTELTCKGI